MIKTFSTVDKKLISEIEAFLVNPKSKKKFTTLVICCALATAVSVFLKSYFIAIVLFAATIVLGTSRINLKKTTVKNALKSLENGDFTYIITFGEENMHIKNTTTGQESTLPCFMVDTVLDREDSFILFTRQWQFIPIFKENLDSPDEFLKYLKNLAPCMQVVRR